MSEKIYAWLLRLYPSSFQRAYGEEALQLFRDRARDERGFLSSLRLWLDLLGDLAISLPREYRAASAAVVISQAPYLSDGTPSFHTLDVEALSFRSLCYGGVASLVVYGSILVLIGHGGNLLANPARDSQRTPRSSETIQKRRPTIILSYVPAKPASGSMVTLTATVSAVGGETPTGSVRFLDGITVLNMGELDDGTVTVKGKLPHSATHTLRATYLGDAKYSPVSSTAEKQ
ncbi:MAG: Ig-like domain repeat protein [Edaphobacter sp.]|nr:Ig-like domain repeat protein [Edaphobacter sp.]